MQLSTADEIIKVQPKGLITIPKKLRESVGLSDRSLVRISTDKGRLIIEPVRALPYPVRSYTDKELDEFLAFDEEQGRELRRRKIIK